MLHDFQRQLEHLGAGTPVCWQINLSHNKIRWNTRSWNSSPLEKMLHLTPIERVSYFKDFLFEVAKKEKS